MTTLDEQQFQNTVARLDEINEAIKKLDPAIRADAFAVLKGYASGEGPSEPQSGTQDPATSSQKQDLDLSRAEEFFSKHTADKPHKAARLAAAFYYSECVCENALGLSGAPS